jgi:DNA invertase Pin-like site-specific DNA recombinase
MIAVGYVRRSKESGERTVSLEDQRERVAAYCAERGWPLVEVLVDDGVSGGRRQRLERLAERVRATGARAIVVGREDCAARRSRRSYFSAPAGDRFGG